VLNFVIEILAKALAMAFRECASDLNLCDAKSKGVCPLQVRDEGFYRCEDVLFEERNL